MYVYVLNLYEYHLISFMCLHEMHMHMLHVPAHTFSLINTMYGKLKR